MQRLKVAIFGASSNGLYLAWRLAGKGHTVVVFERRDELAPRASSALVSERMHSFVPGLADAIENRIMRCRISFPRKTIVLRLEPPFFCLPLMELNNILAKQAFAAGVEIRFGHPFSGEKNDLEPYLGSFDRIVGCDGPRSKIRSALAVPDPKFWLGMQIFADERDSSDTVDVWPANGGFYWRIPRGRRVEYGIMGALHSAKTDFEKFCKAHGISSLYTHESGEAMIPQGLRLPRHERVTLCGDAAGLTKPWSGGGLLWGFRAADILAETFPDFAAYRRRAQRIFLPQMAMGKAATLLVHWVGNTVPFLIPAGIISRIGYDNDFMPLAPR